MLPNVIGSPSAMPCDVPMGCPYCIDERACRDGPRRETVAGAHRPVITTSRASRQPHDQARLDTALHHGDIVADRIDDDGVVRHGRVVWGMAIIEFYRTRRGWWGPSGPCPARAARGRSKGSRSDRARGQPALQRCPRRGIRLDRMRRTPAATVVPWLRMASRLGCGSVARNRRIDQHGPGVDAAFEVVQVREAVVAEVLRRLLTPDPVVAVEHDLRAVIQARAARRGTPGRAVARLRFEPARVPAPCARPRGAAKCPRGRGVPSAPARRAGEPGVEA